MKNLIKYLLILCGLVPVIVIPNVFFPHVFSKVFVFSALISISSLLFLMQFIQKRDFSEEVIKKIYTLLKNKIVVFLAGFVGVSLISVLLATDTYNAFWGNVERSDGFVMLVSIFGFFLLSLLFFEKKDWITFFKVNIFSTVILLSSSFSQVVSSAERTGSLLGNPAFFAGYLLFSITSSLIVFKESKNQFWKYFSGIVAVLSVIFIFFTETRGTILGLFFGIFSILLFFIFGKQSFFYKNFNFRKISIVLITLGIIFSCIFMLTRGSNIWKKIPGISRISEISLQDKTTSSRLIVWEMGLDSVKLTNQTKEFLMGWGMENLTLTFGEYYNPKIYKNDPTFFDRSHNKYLDVLITTGIFGFIFYVLVWVYSIRLVINNKHLSFVDLSILFFLSSFGVHLMFVFDQFPTSLVLYSIFAFVVFLSINTEKDTLSVSKKYFVIVKILLITLFGFIFFAFLRGNLVSFIQMRQYLSSVNDINKSSLETINKSFKIDSPAQYNVRSHFLDFAVSVYGSDFDSEEVLETIMDTAIIKGEEYSLKRKYHFRFLNHIANAYNRKYEVTGNVEFLKESEMYMRKALSFAPLRPELNNNLIFNLMHQKRFEEALSVADDNIARDNKLDIAHYYKAVVLYYQGEQKFSSALKALETSFDLKEESFKERKVFNTRIYGDLLKYFYSRKDKENFITASHRLIKNDYPNSGLLIDLLEYVEKNIWPPVDFK